MITIIGLTVIGVLIALINVKNKIDHKKEMFFFLFIGAFFGAHLGFLISLFIPLKTKMVTDETYYLETLQDSNRMNGSFFLGIGSINEEMKYVFYYKVDEGYKMKQISHENTLIKYTNETPKWESYKHIPTDAFINHFSTRSLKSCRYTNRNILFVPKGTIKQGYNLDAQ